jgi:hypothetical protein
LDFPLAGKSDLMFRDFEMFAPQTKRFVQSV